MVVQQAILIIWYLSYTFQCKGKNIFNSRYFQKNNDLLKTIELSWDRKGDIEAWSMKEFTLSSIELQKTVTSPLNILIWNR